MVRKLQPFDKIKQLRQAALVDEARWLMPSLRVFVAGPFIDISKAADDPANSSDPPFPAQALRYHLAKQLEQDGHTMYLGEDVEMRLLGEKNFGPYSNAVIFERHYIISHCDAVVAIPSSPGSFCEIGDWVTTRETCAKLLLLIDQRYRGQVNYINHGIVKQAEKFGATVSYENFTNLPATTEVVRTFILEIHQSKRVEQLYGR